MALRGQQGIAAAGSFVAVLGTAMFPNFALQRADGTSLAAATGVSDFAWPETSNSSKRDIGEYA